MRTSSSERIDEHLGEAVAVVFGQRVAEDGEIAEKIGGAGVGRERGVGGNGTEDCGVAPRRIMMQAMSRRMNS